MRLKWLVLSSGLLFSLQGCFLGGEDKDSSTADELKTSATVSAQYTIKEHNEDEQFFILKNNGRCLQDDDEEYYWDVDAPDTLMYGDYKDGKYFAEPEQAEIYESEFADRIGFSPFTGTSDDIYGTWSQNTDFNFVNMSWSRKITITKSKISEKIDITVCPADYYVFEGSTAKKISCTEWEVPYKGKTLVFEEGFDGNSMVTRRKGAGKTCEYRSLFRDNEESCKEKIHEHDCDGYDKKMLCAEQEFNCDCLNSDPDNCAEAN